MEVPIKKVQGGFITFIITGYRNIFRYGFYKLGLAKPIWYEFEEGEK